MKHLKNNQNLLMKIFFIFIPVLFIACSVPSIVHDDHRGHPIGMLPHPYGTTTTVVQEEPDNKQNHFYFSYDDSASTAAVDLVKYSLNQLQRIPDPSLARPWEFLNDEHFNGSGDISTGLFRVSMGLLNQTAIGDLTGDYCLGVHVISPAITLEERKNAVITLVADISGSMSESNGDDTESKCSKMELMKYGLTRMVNQSLKEGDVVNLILFSTEAGVSFENKKFPQDKSLMLNQISLLKPAESTNLNAGINLGYQIAQKTFDPSKMNRVILLTDAYANTGEINPSVISSKTFIHNSEGIYFSGIGLGSGFNEAFLNELTDAGKGAYFTAITRNDILKVMDDRFIALLSVAARDVTFRLDYPEELKHIESAGEEVSQNPQEVQPTNFSYNTRQYFFEKFTGNDLEKIAAGAMKLTIYYQDPATGIRKEESVSFICRDLFEKETENIKNAQSIYLFNRFLANQISYEEVNRVFKLFYENFDSPLYLEYKSLIERLNELRNKQ